MKTNYEKSEKCLNFTDAFSHQKLNTAAGGKVMRRSLIKDPNKCEECGYIEEKNVPPETCV